MYRIRKISTQGSPDGKGYVTKFYLRSFFKNIWRFYRERGDKYVSLQSIGLYIYPFSLLLSPLLSALSLLCSPTCCIFFQFPQLPHRSRSIRAATTMCESSPPEARAHRPRFEPSRLSSSSTSLSISPLFSSVMCPAASLSGNISVH